jgi:predicted house-cleaning NTP pyrophosphatase (Maf/HAM1 superfamily)
MCDGCGLDLMNKQQAWNHYSRHKNHKVTFSNMSPEQIEFYFKIEMIMETVRAQNDRTVAALKDGSLGDFLG